MKLLIAAITFVTTLGILFLIETGKSPKEDSARIIEALKEGNMSTVVSVMPSPIKIPLPTPAPTQTPTKTPSSTPPSVSPSPFPTPSETPPPATTLTPALIPTLSPATTHMFYTSSYPTAKKYYCDTDNDWKTLSPKYLKSFSSEEELLKNYPNRILDDPCK